MKENKIDRKLRQSMLSAVQKIVFHSALDDEATDDVNMLVEIAKKYHKAKEKEKLGES